ncbi:hypothetical protein [Actinopolymorpha alba]|uniref:hypothetical protein n=1 Tax=Actinopolymorpha alba TaxID=533267 RepID=UPI0012F66FF3|nr:hypothetical protein [Actinopolymorpha alba]
MRPESGGFVSGEVAMRDNGLNAASYVAIADLDPDAADAMLTILRQAQVAAYTEPCPPVPGLCLEIRFPSVPCDRLYVDASAQERARTLLGDNLPKLRDDGPDSQAGSGVEASPSDRTSPDDRESGGAGDAVTEAAGDSGGEAGGDSDPADHPEPDPDRSRMATFDEERAWADIVAGYDRDLAGGDRPWPALEDVDESLAQPTELAGTDDPGDDRSSSGARDDHAAEGSRGSGGRPPSEERYVPPPPPPLPPLDSVTKVAWLALFGGPAVLLVATVADIYVPAWFALLGVVAFIGGFLALVLRMKGGPPDDDDGAIV